MTIFVEGGVGTKVVSGVVGAEDTLSCTGVQYVINRGKIWIHSKRTGAVGGVVLFARFLFDTDVPYVCRVGLF